MGWIGALVALVGGVYSAAENKQQAKKVEERQDEARTVERRLQEFEAARERRKQVHAAMVQRAVIANQAAASGMTDSSAPMVAGNEMAQGAASNILDLNQRVASSNTMTDMQSRINKAASEGPSLGSQVLGQVSSQYLGGFIGSLGQSAGRKIN